MTTVHMLTPKLQASATRVRLTNRLHQLACKGLSPSALKGKYVGIEELGNGIWRVFYRNVFLGFFNENELRNKEKSIRLEINLV